MTDPETSPMNAPAKPLPIDPILTERRTLFSARALFTVIDLLKTDLKTTEGGWTKRLTEAMQKMNEPLREEVNEDKLGQKAAKEMLLTARKFRRTRDQLEEEKREDLSKRKQVIAGFQQALDECLAIEGDTDAAQLHLLDGQSGIAGMGWASAATVKSVYSAIKLLDEKGHKLHPTLAELLVDLGTAGIEAVPINLTAGEAIENETPPPAANDDAATEAADEAPLPF